MSSYIAALRLVTLNGISKPSLFPIAFLSETSILLLIDLFLLLCTITIIVFLWVPHIRLSSKGWMYTFYSSGAICSCPDTSQKSCSESLSSFLSQFMTTISHHLFDIAIILVALQQHITSTTATHHHSTGHLSCLWSSIFLGSILFNRRSNLGKKIFYLTFSWIHMYNI